MLALQIAPQDRERGLAAALQSDDDVAFDVESILRHATREAFAR
jgi:hypothetical protein